MKSFTMVYKFDAILILTDVGALNGVRENIKLTISGYLLVNIDPNVKTVTDKSNSTLEGGHRTNFIAHRTVNPSRAKSRFERAIDRSRAALQASRHMRRARRFGAE